MKNPPPPLTLASDNIPRDVIPALEALLEDAKKGTLIGFAITAIYTRPMRRVIAKAVGEAERSLIFTVGTYGYCWIRMMQYANKKILNHSCGVQSCCNVRMRPIRWSSNWT